MARRWVDVARNVVAWLKGETFAVDFSDRAFFRQLDRSVDALARSRRSFDAGDSELARELAVEYFRARSSPRFFVDAEAVPALVARFATDHPEECARLERWTNRVSSEGVDVYAAEAPGLQTDFDWERIALGPGEDILYPLRPHRFGFAPKLALASLRGDPAIAPLQSAISSWLRFAGSSGKRRAFFSTLVVIYRVVALHWTFVLLSGERGDDRVNASLFDVLKIIASDVRFLERFAGGSTPNNHLLADRFGSWYVSSQFPELTASSGSANAAGQLFLEELDRQFYDDGTCFEHSMHYHELGCELAVAYLLLSRRNAYPNLEWASERTKRMLSFQLSLAVVDPGPPPVGDGTEDPLFPLSTEDGPDPSSLARCYELLYSESNCAPRPGRDNGARAFWLLGGATPKASPSVAVPNAAFPVGGFFLLADQSRDAALAFRTGPAVGTEVFAGHMHSDVLTVYGSVNGRPLFVEAGTYTYSYAAGVSEGTRWRSHFMGRDSHNGWILPGRDPLGPPLEGRFRSRDVPLRVASVHRGVQGVLVGAEGEVGGDNAYAGYVRGVVHVCEEYWLVYDLFPPSSESRGGTIQFQLAPSTELVKTSGSVVALSGGGSLARIFCAGTGDPVVCIGETDPACGWVSPRYGELIEAPALRFPVSESAALSSFVVRPGEAVDGVLQTIAIDGGLAMRFECGNEVDIVMVSRSSEGEAPLSAWGVDFVGGQAWLRTRNGKLASLRWTEGRSLRFDGHEVRATHEPASVLVAEREGARLRVLRGSASVIELD